MFNRKHLSFGLASLAVCLVAFQAYGYWNSQITPEKVAAGKLLFEKDWSVNDPDCGNGDGLGPVFNATSCVACHSQGGIGGSSGNHRNVLGFEVLPDRKRNRDSMISSVVHANSTQVALRESRENVIDLFPRIDLELGRQSTIFPNFDRYSSSGSMDGCGAPPPPCGTQPASGPGQVTPVVFHELNSPALFGAGLIDELSSVQVNLYGAKRTAIKIGREFDGDFDANGIGLARVVPGGIGKFGWKGQFSSLEDFVASACAVELGLTNHRHSQSLARAHKPDDNAKQDMTRKQLNELVCFVRALPRPQQIMPEDAEARIRVKFGEEVFEKIGCTDCHVESLGGIDGLYSDFHLYNLEDLEHPASGYVHEQVGPEFQVPNSHPQPDQWQTPPLWGVADSAPYFHDGGSTTLEDAILRHKGQAIHSRKSFKNLSNYEKDALIEFLGTLRAPQ